MPFSYQNNFSRFQFSSFTNGLNPPICMAKPKNTIIQLRLPNRQVTVVYDLLPSIAYSFEQPQAITIRYCCRNRRGTTRSSLISSPKPFTVWLSSPLRDTLEIHSVRHDSSPFGGSLFDRCGYWGVWLRMTRPLMTDGNCYPFSFISMLRFWRSFLLRCLLPVIICQFSIFCIWNGWRDAHDLATRLGPDDFPSTLD